LGEGAKPSQNTTPKYVEGVPVFDTYPKRRGKGKSQENRGLGPPIDQNGRSLQSTLGMEGWDFAYRGVLGQTTGEEEE